MIMEMRPVRLLRVVGSNGMGVIEFIALDRGFLGVAMGRRGRGGAP
ncbi:hypothetical protein ACFHW1_25015 [Micromonospora sp. LOL_014]